MTATVLRFGVDVGGTKIEAVALDPGGTVVARHRRPTPQDSYPDTLDAVAGVIGDVEDMAGVKATRIGIGTPGSISPETGLMRNANATRLNGNPFDTDLAKTLARPVRLMNDANCFAWAEAKAGAAMGADTVFGVIIGTGVGAGIVVHGKPLDGLNRIAGEWGHNPLPAPTPEELPGRLCYCGRYGCIETWCSGPALAKDHQDETGMAMPPQEIVAVAQAGDADAQATLDRHRSRLARALAAVVNMLDPDVIVLGGGLSNLPGLAEALPETMRPHVFGDVFQTQVRRNVLGDSAGVIGAAWLWSADPEDES